MRMSCLQAIECVSKKVSIEFQQYPQFATKFKAQCIEEAFDEIDILIEDFADGFDESVILESISDEIEINNDDKQLLCKLIHNVLSTFGASQSHTLELKQSINESLLPRHQPTFLSLERLNYDIFDININTMKKMVLSQVKPLNDSSILQVLTIGQNNNFPLLIYLIDMYHRHRISWYHRNYGSLKSSKHYTNQLATMKHFNLDDFFQEINTKILDCNYESIQFAIKSSVHRHGLFYSLSLAQHQLTSKIYDSLQIFTTYTISLLKSVNDMIQHSQINFPIQIDYWIIPQKIQNISVFDEDDKSDENSDEEFHQKFTNKGWIP